MSLTKQSYFQLFDLPASFHVDQAALERAYKQKQAEYHPDKFSDSTDAERVKILQQATFINDAYDTLKSPLKRAAYLLRLADTDPEEHNQSHLDGSFLIAQLTLREDLEQYIKAEDLDGIAQLKNSATKDRDDAVALIASQFEAEETIKAKTTYNQLQFLYKLLDEIDAAEEKLLDY